EAAEDVAVAAHEASFDDAGEQGLIPEKRRGRLGDLAELNPALEDLVRLSTELGEHRSVQAHPPVALEERVEGGDVREPHQEGRVPGRDGERRQQDRKSTRLNSSHVKISYAVFCLKKKKTMIIVT